jgi:GTP-binding protein
MGRRAPAETDFVMFIDHVIVDVIAGNGGDGCMSFRREKYVPHGGPDGGDGGHGGDVVVEASDQRSTLLDLHNARAYRAEDGQHGQGKRMRGKQGRSVTIYAPPGSVIRDADTGERIAELLTVGDRCVVAAGGRGGFGNEHFKSSQNQAPRRTTPGRAGVQRKLEITLKLIADVGLVGEPNAGKSTLLGVLSAAQPKVAPYPFTTKTPVLGIVPCGEYQSFVMVDIPGLIEGASEGKGMGKAFLRHVERCRVLLYLVDVTHDDPEGSYHTLRNELLRHDSRLLEKPSILALTKCDLVEGGVGGVKPQLLTIHSRVVPISAVAGQGLGRLIEALKALLG